MPAWLAGERRLPTFEAMLGAVGGLVALAGVFALFSEVPEEEARAGGLALALLALVVGCVLTAVGRSSTLDAAGVVLAAGAVAPLVFLILNDPEQVDSESDLLVSALVAVLVWIVLFAVGPARGHGLFLGLALFGMWTGALGQTDPGTLLFPFWLSPGTYSEVRVEPPMELRGPDVPDPDLISPPEITIPDLRTPRTFPTPSTVVPPTFSEPTPMPSFRFEPPQRFRPEPSTTTSTSTTTTTTSNEQSLGRMELVSYAQGDEDDEGTLEPIDPFGEPPLAPGVVSILFGLAYVVGAAWLDSARLRRLASPFHFVGLHALTVGTLLLGPRLGAVAAGAAGIVFGVAVVALGVLARRRFVAWYAGGALALALTSVVASAFEDSPAAAAICLLVVGAAVVGVGVAGGLPSTAPTRSEG